MTVVAGVTFAADHPGAALWFVASACLLLFASSGLAYRSLHEQLTSTQLERNKAIARGDELERDFRRATIISLEAASRPPTTEAITINVEGNLHITDFPYPPRPPQDRRLFDPDDET